jgi:hypothetical protein
MKQETGEGITVTVGDEIEVENRIGYTVRGVVATVDFYDGGGWQIEIDKANVQGGYSSWKQRYDGGRITKLNGKVLDLPKMDADQVRR